ncbi:carboxypeptidase-like regulatory domain-containing protein [Desulfosarcina ovata]|uniref:Carboxypeptidase regulatory-like domain-containing protein n=1 Tax=Desulfosarcina ovata subsp. ovata TaxID=2752305 RepID=A0A5K8ACH6_9BACT|nr:carboxypeptidase-like regulatory domain-containing protein [Desulfosarcina ovata]BBO89640.1 hypothetical protein DSCOOX_28200 [Desulfosarcina ovata subsp. ovata]
MKTLSAIVLAVAVFMGAPDISFADSTVPVAYWKLLDEERYIHRFDLERFGWRTIRNIRRQNMDAGKKTKFLTLNALPPSGNIGDMRKLDGQYLVQASILVRDPNGDISQIPAMTAEKDSIGLPEDNMLMGRYLLGARIPLGEHDVDADGISESVFLCAKHLVVHRRHGGRMGHASVVFFDDGGKMPLEIGPAINTAKSKFGGGMQIPHETYEMMVKYQGRPLPGAAVTVTTEGSQWEKTFITDKAGKFAIMPTDDRFSRREWQNYLYTATHLDRQTHTYYVATLPTVVYRNQPEWRSKAMGFAFWSIIGTGVTLLMVAGLTRRRRRRDRQALIVFENHRIQRDLP